MQTKKNKKAKSSLAISQIIILIIGIIAIAYAIGSSIDLISAPFGWNPTGPSGGTTATSTAATHSALSILATSAGLGLAAGFLSAQIVKWLGGNSRLATSVGLGTGFGTFTGTALYKFGVFGGWTSAGIGLGVGFLIFAATYKKQKQEIITYNCYPWDAPTGGKYCEDCNKNSDLGCSEYQCKSLGQACELVNVGEVDQKCVWKNPNDVNPPVIKAWDDALMNEDYEYDPAGISFPSREDNGVKIRYTDSTDGCIKAFTPFSFGVETDEPAKCKLDTVRGTDFDTMKFFVGGKSTFAYNHTQIMSLPSPSALAAENLTLQNNGEFDLYVRCQDANGNYNVGTFVFKYCVDKSLDTTPPLIMSTNLINGMPIAHNQSTIDLEVYVNEPVECKWSHQDKSYNDMETVMVCSERVTEINAQMLYTCKTTLEGLKSETESRFYFRCSDQPELKNTANANDRITNTESYKFSLLGTRPLIISEVMPNDTVKDSTEAVKVTLEAETREGYKEGESICYYSDTGRGNSYIQFYKTNSYTHSQDLWLSEDSYTYYIKCIDLGGNSDIETLEFDVGADTDAPIVTRAYHEGTLLRIITSEEARCVYSTTDCDYILEDGTSMRNIKNLDHYADWNLRTTYYVKCEDEYGNQPLPAGSCSIIVKPIDMNYE